MDPLPRRTFLLFLPWIAAASTLRSKIVVPDILKPLAPRILEPLAPGWYQVRIAEVSCHLSQLGTPYVKVKQRVLDGSNRDVFSYYSHKAPGHAIPILRAGGRLPEDLDMRTMYEVDMQGLEGTVMNAKIETHDYPEGIKRQVVVDHAPSARYGKKWSDEG